MQKSILSFIGFVGISLFAGFVGSFSTMESITTWYPTLVHPSWTPPNWVFGPVWTILYVLMGTSAFLVSRSRRVGKYLALWLFIAHLFVNAFWTIAFFGMHELLLAVIVIIILLGLIVALMRMYWQHSRTATYLMVPYLLWVLYATSLSLGFLVLN